MSVLDVSAFETVYNVQVTEGVYLITDRFFSRASL